MKMIPFGWWMWSDSGVWMAVILTVMAWSLAVMVTLGFWTYDV